MTNDFSNPAQTPNPGADRRPKLSDPHVVERLFVSLTREAVGCRVAAARGIISDQDAITVSDKEIEHRALIFLNRDKGYSPVPDWNLPGKIDAYLAKRLQLDARGAESIVKAALGQFILEVLEKVDLPQNPNISESEWKEKTRDLVIKYRDLFMGLRSRIASGASIEELSAEQPVAVPVIAPPPAAVVPKVEPAVPAQYLGDPQVVENVLTSLALATMKPHKAAELSVITVEDAIAIEKKEIRDSAQIFLGKDKRYVVDPNWNAPGGIDAFLVQYLHLTEIEHESIIAAALSRFVVDLHGKIGGSPMVPEEMWAPIISEVVARYRNLMLGLPPEGPVPTDEIAKVQDAPAALPDWLEPETKPAPKPAPKPTPKIQAPKPSPKKVEPELVGAAEAPKKGGSGTWKWALIAVVLLGGVVAAVTLIPRATKVVEKPVVVEEAKKKEPATPKVFILRNGKILMADGKEIKSQDAANAASAGENAGESGESESLEFWYDVNIASGVARFLVAANRDIGFTTDFDAPVPWDLWLTDEMGNKKLIHRSVFRAKFSPDGTKIAYTTSDSVMHVEDLEGKELARTTRAYEPNWSGDGKIIVFELVPENVVLYPPQAFQLARFDWQKNQVEVITDGRFDDVIPHFHPSGNWILFVSGDRTGGASFWKVPTTGGPAVQLTNLRYNEMQTDLVPTPYRTTVWSQDGKWFLFDFKAASSEETWGLEFDEKGMFKRALKVSDGLSPQWTGPTTFMCQKRAGEGFEMVPERLPGS